MMEKMMDGMKIKNLLLKIDAFVMAVLCIPGIIIGLPYLIVETRNRNRLMKEINSDASYTKTGEETETGEE